MIPHKTSRGDRALKRLRTFEDIPARYTKQKTFVVPLAMRMLSLQLGRKYCTVDRLSHEVGWKYKHVIEDYERRRKSREELNAKKLTLKRVCAVYDIFCYRLAEQSNNLHLFFHITETHSTG